MARDELKEKIFPRLFRLALCDRTYEFVGGKDAGKGARLPGKGGIVYFLAVNGPPCDKPPSGFWTVEAAWRALADFRRCATVPKMCARLELAFSATAPALVEADGESSSSSWPTSWTGNACTRPAPTRGQGTWRLDRTGCLKSYPLCSPPIGGSDECGERG